MESAFLNVSISSDNPLRSQAAGGLGKFSSEKVSIRLLEMVGDSDFLVALSATEALKNMPYNIIMGQHLPALIELIYTSAESFALEAIATIQSRCQYYNYDITQSLLPLVQEAAIFILQTLEVTIMTDKQPIINFSQPNSTIGVNYAGDGSNVKFQQNVKNVTEQDRTELQALLIQLAQTYPITTEAQKQTFIQKFLERIESTPGFIKVIFAGGMELLKIICPPAGIPVEMTRSLYEGVKERYSQP